MKKFVTFAVFNILAFLVVMYLWNWLMPSIFGIGPVSFLQACGLTILCNLLFKPYKLD